MASMPPWVLGVAISAVRLCFVTAGMSRRALAAAPVLC